MARLSLSKSTLSQLIRQLKTYQNFLPSLDLKRRQLLAEQEKARLERRELLASSAKVISQRVNLFERVLIPKTEADVQRIRVYLSDSERASIVRAKIAKGEKGLA